MIRTKAAEVLAKWPKDAEILRQVDALLNSLGDTLSDGFVLRELQAIEVSGMPFQEVFAEL